MQITVICSNHIFKGFRSPIIKGMEEAAASAFVLAENQVGNIGKIGRAHV